MSGVKRLAQAESKGMKVPTNEDLDRLGTSKKGEDSEKE